MAVGLRGLINCAYSFLYEYIREVKLFELVGLTLPAIFL